MKMMLFDKFENKTVITGVLTAIDPIYIGSSGDEALDPTNVDGSVLKDNNGNPLIPGSSLKGVVRSNFEMVMRSVGKNVCDIFDHKNSCDDEKDCCVACALFGGKGIASHLSFKDAPFIGEKCLFEHRDGIGIDRDTGAVARGAKYNFEVIPKGSKFSLYMTAENINEDQEKQLNYIIRLLQSGELCVGGKTTRGLGRIQLEDMSIKKTTADDIRKELGL